MKVVLKRTTDALTRYKAKKGEYPSSLADLVPEYLERIPETPWGHPFLYRAFVNQPIEVPSLRPELQSVLGVTGRPQLRVRFGHGPRAPYSLRRPPYEVLAD